MFLFRWLGRPTDTTPPARRPAARLGMEALDDRLTPAATGSLLDPSVSFESPWARIGTFSASDSTATATQFAVYVRGDAYAGTATQVTVVALDANGRPVPNYTGTVTLTSTDAGATLPAAYTFTAADRGRHTFTVTPSATGSVTVTATDTAGLTGKATLDVATAPVAASLFVRAERDATTGQVTRVLVAALDSGNRLVRNYTGTVTLTSTDTGATLPAAYTFTADDRGVHVFEVTPSAAGDQTITATDANGVTGKATVSVTAATTATKFAVVALPQAAAGVETRFAIVALDANDHVVRGYTGTVTITTTDAKATVPASYTFTAADRGVQEIEATFATTGSQTITVTSAADATVTGTATVNVVSATGRFGFGEFNGFGFGRGPGRGRR
jgi:hypothetical protein